MDKASYPDGVLERLQDAARSILAAIDATCRENGITYFIDSGTCLGAVRHGGFIPWDDDADVGMPIEDYRRFLELAPKALPQGFSLHTMRDTKGLPVLWAKVFLDGTLFYDDLYEQAGCRQSIFVDVFPYVALDRDPVRADERGKAAVRLQQKAWLHSVHTPRVPASMRTPGLFRAGFAIGHYTIGRLYTPQKLMDSFESLLAVNDAGDRWVDTAYPQFGAFATDVLLPTREIAFCGLRLMGPHDTDSYLTTLYGDYRQFPPMSERYTHLPVMLDFGDGVNVMER